MWKWRNRRRENEPGDQPEHGGEGHEPSDGDLTDAVQAMLNPYDNAAGFSDGDKLYVNINQVLQNTRDLMERIDQDPHTPWGLEDIGDFDELYGVPRFGMGHVLITDTANAAREILTNRWPTNLITNEIDPRARLVDLLDNAFPALTEDHEALGKAIVNRTLAADANIDEHPEVDHLKPDDQFSVWIAILAWFYVKTFAIQQRINQGPDPDLPDKVDHPGPSYNPATGTFQLGVSTDGAVPWHLHKPGRGVQHGLIAGPSHLGKTNTCKLIAAETMGSGLFVVMIAEPAGPGPLAEIFANIAHSTADDIPGTIELLQAAGRIVDERTKAGGYTDPTIDRPGILLIIDDAHVVLHDPDTAQLANHIADAGGPAGVGLVLASKSLDPADYAHNTELMSRLSKVNSMVATATDAKFLQRLHDEHD
jgi:hypothetical protein